MEITPEMLARLKPDERAILRWHMRRRPEQTCPNPRPFIWFLRGGRGSGKTLTAANHLFEYARFLALTLPRDQENDIIRIGLVGDTFSDVQKTMCEGQSGLISIIPRELQKKFNRSTTELWVDIPSADRQIYFAGFTSQVPEKLRGPQFHAVWLDEPAKFQDSNSDPMGRDTTWSNLMLCTRLGKEMNAPHIVVTGTPTPCRLIRYIENHPESEITFMTTWNNIDNLPDSYRRELEMMNKNSRTYRQEIMAEILTDNPDAVFNEESINANRYTTDPDGEGRLLPDELTHKVLGWDPSVGVGEDGDEAGIILTGYTPEVKAKAKGLGGRGRPTIIEPAHAYILKDYSGHISPYDQAELIVDIIFEEQVQDLVYETNQGGAILIQMLTQILKDKTQNFTIRKEKNRRREDLGSIQRYNIDCILENPYEPGTYYKHSFTASGIQASKNKKTRAEVAAVAYDQGRVHNPPLNELPTCEIEACQAHLELQQTTWNPNHTTSRNSPDRMDSLCYTLMLIFGSGGRKSGPNSLLIAPTAPSPDGERLRDDQRIHSEAQRKIKPTSIYSMDVINTRRGGRITDGRIDPRSVDSPWSRIVLNEWRDEDRR